MVDTGPRMAAVRVGAIQIAGFFMMLPIWSIDVPKPCEMSPPIPLSLKLMIAKPIICAQQPAVAAPAASPSIPSITQMATELMGRVRAQPTMTETVIPIQNGLSLVALFTTSPR